MNEDERDLMNSQKKRREFQSDYLDHDDTNDNKRKKYKDNDSVPVRRNNLLKFLTELHWDPEMVLNIILGIMTGVVLLVTILNFEAVTDAIFSVIALILVYIVRIVVIIAVIAIAIFMITRRGHRRY